MSRKFHVFAAAFVLLLVVSICFNIAQALPEGAAEPGSDQDPLISKSYVDQNVGQLSQKLLDMQGQLDQMKKDNEGLTQKLNAQDAAIKALQEELKNAKAQTPTASSSTSTTTPSSGGTAAAITGTVNTPILNVRSQANTTSQIVAKIAKGETVTVVAKGAEWHKIKTSKGVAGYVLGKYITIK